MSLPPLRPAGWPRPRGYENGFRVPAGHDLVVTGGMIGWDAEERLVPGGLVPQFEQALRNLLAVLAEGGAAAEHVVRMVVYVVDRAEYLEARPALAGTWRGVMGRHYPAMALVVVAGLVEEGARVEIEAMAAVPARAS